MIIYFFNTYCEIIPFLQAIEKQQYQNILQRNITKQLIGVDEKTLCILFQELYEQHHKKKKITTSVQSIEKIVHHIWLGSPLPKQFESYVASWQKKHPDWKHLFWTESDIAQLHLYNQKLYDNAKNWGQKSDIARYEILYQFGGLYVDTDFECLQPFDLFHEQYDFYTGMLPPDTGILQLGNGLIGAKKGHPFLWYCIENIRNSVFEKTISSQSGPLFFTKMLYLFSKKTAKDIVFPPCYFYPKGVTQGVVKNIAHTSQKPFAVHHWARSWCGFVCI